MRFAEPPSQFERCLAKENEANGDNRGRGHAVGNIEVDSFVAKRGSLSGLMRHEGAVVSWGWKPKKS